jgi:hypothetical protein
MKCSTTSRSKMIHLLREWQRTERAVELGVALLLGRRLGLDSQRWSLKGVENLIASVRRDMSQRMRDNAPALGVMPAALVSAPSVSVAADAASASDACGRHRS